MKRVSKRCQEGAVRVRRSRGGYYIPAQLQQPLSGPSLPLREKMRKPASLPTLPPTGGKDGQGEEKKLERGITGGSGGASGEEEKEGNMPCFIKVTPGLEPCRGGGDGAVII